MDRPKQALILFIIVLVVSVQQGMAQNYTCGTKVSAQQITYENALVNSIDHMVMINRTIHINVFITLDANGNQNFNVATLDAAINGLNTSFAPIGVTFVKGTVKQVANYNYDLIRIATNESSFMAENYTPKTINLYLVKELRNETNQEIGAYTYYPSANTDAIFMEKGSVLANFLIEQMGHFLNLYHTHETAFGNETVDEAGCSTKGDRCCDTPADPNLSGRVSSSCAYTGTNKDANNAYYVPSVSNFMAASLITCKCYFTEDQYIRMLNCLAQAKQGLW